MRPVLIVEDHPLVAEATGGLLVRYGADVTTTICANATQTIAALDSQLLDWFRIFLDLDVPGAYGLSLAREIRERQLAARCCVVSAFERQDYIDELRAWGFLGYIVKAVPMAEFTSAINDVIGGIAHFPARTSAERAASPVRLTRRQTEVLELVQAGLSSKQIASDLHLAEGTVNNLVAAIVQIFEAGSRTHAVARAIELGVLEKHPGSTESATSESPLLPRSRRGA
jgi:DNA-binding NarL/FixJ family response regulator